MRGRVTRLWMCAAAALFCAASAATNDGEEDDDNEPAEGPAFAVDQIADAYGQDGELDETETLALIDKAMIRQIAVASDKEEGASDTADDEDAERDDDADDADAGPSAGRLAHPVQASFTFADLSAWDENDVVWTRGMIREAITGVFMLTREFPPIPLLAGRRGQTVVDDLFTVLTYDVVERMLLASVSDPQLARLIAGGELSILAPIINLEGGVEGAALSGNDGVRIRQRVNARDAVAPPEEDME